MEPEQQHELLDRCSLQELPELQGPPLQVLLQVLLLLQVQQGRPRRRQQRGPRGLGASCGRPGAPR